jgi:hypothetical protein
MLATGLWTREAPPPPAAAADVEAAVLHAEEAADAYARLGGPRS